MKATGGIRDFDFILLLSAIGLVAFGVVLIYSGSIHPYGGLSRDLSHPVTRQILFGAVGVLVAIFVSRTDYRSLGNIAIALYFLAIGTLLFVIAFGESAYGSTRWVTIAGVQIQPSELAKLIVIVVLAKYMSDRKERLQEMGVFITSLAIAGLPMLLVFAEPDLGSAVIFAVIWLGMALMAGMRPSHIWALVTLGVVSIPFAMIAAISDYQRERIALWLDPAKDPLGSGFNILQAEISIGSGGVWGKGLAHGTQTQLDYLRTQTTDYIFSVLGEELGLVGAILLFALFIFLLFRIVRVASISRDEFGRLIATGIAIFIALQAFINIGVNLRLLPVTGIPLPFISQGGSSLLSLFIAIGILESIALRHRRFFAGMGRYL